MPYLRWETFRCVLGPLLFAGLSVTLFACSSESETPGETGAESGTGGPDAGGGPNAGGRDAGDEVEAGPAKDAGSSPGPVEDAGGDRVDASGGTGGAACPSDEDAGAALTVDKLDLLFVVDNSQSMQDEQAKLGAQLPQLLSILTSGVRSDGSTFEPVQDLHLAVVTTDMGVPGLPSPLPDIYNCSKNNFMGDNAVMRRQSGAAEGECAGAALPGDAGFLTYGAQDPTQSSEEIARLFGCIAQVGTGGCGYEMQLDAALKALWPRGAGPEAALVEAANSPYLPPRFLSNTGDSDDPDALGQGGLLGSAAANAGFLRDGDSAVPSALAVVLVTDEDDCSSRDTWHLQNRNTEAVPPELANQPENLRCYYNKDRLQDPQRYVDGLKALRPGHAHLVAFAAIAGVPEDLVQPAVLDGSDERARDEFYDGILSDPRMQETVNAEGNHLEVACRAANEPDLGQGARPARRILEVVRGFGEGGVLQSVCADSFGPAIDVIATTISERRGGTLCSE